MTLRSRLVRPSFVLAAVAASTLMSACAPLLVGGAVMGTSLMVTDRRTSGTQLEDQSIELKAMTRTREAVGERGHVNATSYNRTVLLTGEVAADTDKVAVEQAVAKIEGVRTVVNELVVAGSSSLAARSNDAILTSKVKASFIDAKDVFANAIKVITERGTVYLMGRVTEREANRASDIARAVSGVQKVVRVFEVITEAELAELQPKQGADPVAASASNAAEAVETRGPGSGQRRRLIRLEVSQRRPPMRLHVGVELVHQRRDRQRRRCAGLVEHQAQVLAHPVDAKPKSNLSSTMVLPRLSICQLCAAPLPITSSTWLHVQPGRWPKAMASTGPAPGRRCRSG
jgi:osmotically-inducible protein OsmY